MARQGSLCQSTAHPNAVHRSLIGLCVLTLAGFAAISQSGKAQSVPANASVDLKLRLNWSADQHRFWQVRVAAVDAAGALGDAKISELVNRCESTAATGAFQLGEDGQSLTFTARQPLPAGEFDFRFRGPPGARLNVQVLGSSEYMPRPKSPDDPSWNRLPSKLIPLSELSDGRTISQPGEVGQADQTDPVRWSIERTGDDQVRIEPDAGIPFGKVGGEFSFTVRANALTNSASNQLDLVYELRQASTGKVVAEKRWPVDVDALGNTTSITISEPCPNVAGVYEISCRLEKEDENLLRRLRGKAIVFATSSHPLVVTSPAGGNTAAVSGIQPWQTIGRIHPASKPDWELNQWLPNSSQKLIRRIDPREPSTLGRSQHDGQEVSALPPGESYVASLPSQQAGQPHKIAIRYPADKQTRLRVEIDTSENFDRPMRMFLLADDQPSDAQQAWQTYTFAHYPSGDDEFLRLTNVRSDINAEFASITVMAGPQRLAGAVDQPSSTRLATLKLDGFQWVNRLSEDVARGNVLRKLTPPTAAMHRMFVAAERLMDYAKATGLNSVLIEASQGDRAWFNSDAFMANRKENPWEGDHLEMLMRLADQQAIDVVVGLDLSMQLSTVESLIGQGTNAAALLRQTPQTTVYNTPNPLVLEELRRLIDRLDLQLQAHDSYAGLVLSCGETNHLAPISDARLNQEEVQSFARSVGKTKMTPAQLVAWIQTTGRRPLQQWLQSRSQQIYQNLTQNIRRQTLLLMDDASQWPDANDDEGLAAIVDLRRSHVASLENAISSRAVASKRIKRVAAIAVGHRVSEHSAAKTFMRSASARELSNVVVGYDPQILMVDDSALTLAFSPAVSRMLRGFVSIPAAPLTDIRGADAAAKTVHVRYASRDGQIVLVVNNVAPWSSDLRCELSSELDWSDTARENTDDDANQVRWNIENRHLNATLPPGGMLVLTAPSRPTDPPGPPMRIWSSRVSGGAEAMTDIKERVTAVVERIGVLSDPDPYQELSNGGFEKQGGVGIPGWMHTQHPPTAVRVDSREAIEGNNSVLLTTDEKNTNRAWLVSETIRPPSSGRLAVSLACRGELAGENATHRLRVSIEGTRDGQPFRQATEFDVARDGQWQQRRVVLEAGGVDPTSVESIRLTIDSLSAGRVWIDEIQLHDWFPTTSERGELQGEAFLAVQGLQRGNVTPAARLLHNYWAQYLIDQKEYTVTPPVLQAAQEEEEPSGMADRIKSWLPRPLRF